MTRRQAERAIARRRRELVGALVGDALRTKRDVGTTSQAVARRRPWLFVASSVATGVALGVVARRSPAALVATPLRLLSSSLRWWVAARRLRGGP
jgi:hypothetical protein